MADNFAGMFRDPRSYRDERLQDLMQQRQAISNMGGSMSQLLGQVAAGGGATGAMMAEGLGGMFGMKTREEDKAAQLQDLASNFDLRTPEGMRGMARQLNNLGMTEEAIKLVDLANARENTALDLEYKRKRNKDYAKDPDWEFGVIGQTQDELGNRKTVYGYIHKRDPNIAPVPVNLTGNKPEMPSKEEKVYLLKPDGTLGQPRKTNEGWSEDIPLG